MRINHAVCRFYEKRLKTNIELYRTRKEALIDNDYTPPTGKLYSSRYRILKNRPKGKKRKKKEDNSKEKPTHSGPLWIYRLHY